MLWCRKEGQSGDGGCSLRWSGEHTLIYRGCPVGGSPFHGGGINKIGIHRVVTLVTLPHAPPPPTMGNPEEHRTINCTKNPNP